VLLRLLRGTGIYGLRGMRPVHPLETPSAQAPGLTLIRPLLGIHRAEIECYCRQKNLAPRHDATNDELHHTRNRIRHELLPLLEQYNPGIRKVLVRLAETATTDTETIDFATQQVFQGLLIAADPNQPLTLDRATWCALPVGLQRATLREAVKRVKHNLTDLKFAGVEEARDVLNSDARTAEIAILDDIRIIVQAHAFAIVPSSSYN
jgi:tRNA(Ile)-lysidine synthase